jgi:hypothetical protein
MKKQSHVVKVKTACMLNSLYIAIVCQNLNGQIFTLRTHAGPIADTIYAMIISTALPWNQYWRCSPSDNQCWFKENLQFTDAVLYNTYCIMGRHGMSETCTWLHVHTVIEVHNKQFTTCIHIYRYWSVQ